MGQAAPGFDPNFFVDTESAADPEHPRDNQFSMRRSGSQPISIGVDDDGLAAPPPLNGMGLSAIDSAGLTPSSSISLSPAAGGGGVVSSMETMICMPAKDPAESNADAR